MGKGSTMSQQPLTVSIRLFVSGQLRAFADVTFDVEGEDLTICGFRIVQGNREGTWVAPPMSSYQQNGKIRTKPVIEMSRRLRPKITNAILDEYRRTIGYASEEGPNK